MTNKENIVYLFNIIIKIKKNYLFNKYLLGCSLYAKHYPWYYVKADNRTGHPSSMKELSVRKAEKNNNSKRHHQIAMISQEMDEKPMPS